MKDKRIADRFLEHAKKLNKTEDKMAKLSVESSSGYAFLLDEIRFNGLARNALGEETWKQLCAKVSKVEAGNSRSKSGMVIRKGAPYKEFLNTK
jgi:hypothetical protein